MIANPEHAEYSAIDKYGPGVGNFGFGKYYDTSPKDLSNKKKALLSHTLRLGWSSGCPRPLFCIETYTLEGMAKRYSDCNYMYSRVLHEAESINHILAKQLLLLTPRIDKEIEAGLREPASVPKSHLNFISPMSGLYGYAIPRVLLLRKNSDPNWEQVLIKNIPGTYHPNELLAGITRDISQKPDLNREEILSHIFPKGLLEEENCHATYERFARTLILYAPELCKFYGELPKSQRKELGIAEVPALF